MSEKNHFAALQEIRNWNTDDVIFALKNNGLSECVDACKKREITGEKLLELSEMKLGLWKRDLSIGNIRKLAVFIQSISKMPAKYTICSASSGDDAWDTDFDDDETEDDNDQKTENNIPHGTKLEGKSRLSDPPLQENGKISPHKLVHQNLYTQNNDKQLSPINKNRISLHQNKINIPSVFVTVQSSQYDSSTNSRGNIAKPPFLTVNGSSESIENGNPNEQKNMKPSIPSRPPSLHFKSSPKNSPQTTLPKPPEFDHEGSVLKEICDKLPLEPDMDEYESIDDELLREQIIKSQMSQLKGLGYSQNSIKQNSVEIHRKSPSFLSSVQNLNQPNVSPLSTLHRNNVSQKINTFPQPVSKTELNSALESLKKSPVLPRALVKKEEETFQTSKNRPFVNQEKQQNFLSSPVPLPPRNETRQDTSPTSTLHPSSPKNVLKIIKGPAIIGNSEISRTCKEHEEMKEENDVNENVLNEENYESILELASKKDARVESSEDYCGYLKPISPSSLSPKSKQASRLKSSEKSANGESYGSSGSLWRFKTQQKPHQEKASQEGKKNNTLPKQRAINSWVSEAPRSSATRPLPPPPLPDGNAQRVVKIPLVQMPWYFNVDRARGEDILRNCEDGTFMIRPSTQNALTLTLKYGPRPFNICVRLRPDGKYALGTPKPTEQTFSTVEELVNYYSTNELILCSDGRQAGIVVLTSPPRRDSSQ